MKIVVISMTDGQFRPAPPSAEEAVKVQRVLEILAEVCNEEQALNALRRSHGNVEKAIMALLDDPTSVNHAPGAAMDEMSALRVAVAGVVQDSKCA